jgi:uncharacterized protein YneF (UPF0154 family)
MNSDENDVPALNPSSDDERHPRKTRPGFRSLLIPAYMASLSSTSDQFMPEKNPELDRVALRMKAIRLLNKMGVRKPSQDQIERMMLSITRGD